MGPVGRMGPMGRMGIMGQMQMGRMGVRRGALCLLLLLAGCHSAPRFPAYYYLQRSPVRVAVVPSGNTTDHPEGSIIFDKACEEALRKKGFEVVSADQVVADAYELRALLKSW